MLKEMLVRVKERVGLVIPKIKSTDDNKLLMMNNAKLKDCKNAKPRACEWSIWLGRTPELYLVEGTHETVG